MAVVTGGHPFDAQAFFALLDDVLYDDLGYNWCNVAHPAATALFEHPDSLSRFDLILFYDVPGQDYRIPQAPVQFEPSEAYKSGFERLLACGVPMLFLHHAIIGWPRWPRYAEILGGAVMAEPGELRGREVPDSGYRFGVTHRVTPVADHPVTAGLEDGFEITDQLYMGEVFEETLVPLMRSNYRFDASGFYSIGASMAGRPDSNEGWERPAGNNLIVWARQEKASPIVYVQCGDGPSAYQVSGFRQLLRNSAKWLAEQSTRANGT
ncbi:hypothetical protein JI59_21620 (plasmid) [Novosphingobium pentaromativorans US6-1]|nr:hypothetical protein JI59_21620 [Novosphingobium pentaromativorans US6-1]